MLVRVVQPHGSSSSKLQLSPRKLQLAQAGSSMAPVSAHPRGLQRLPRLRKPLPLGGVASQSFRPAHSRRAGRGVVTPDGSGGAVRQAVGSSRLQTPPAPPGSTHSAALAGTCPGESSRTEPACRSRTPARHATATPSETHRPHRITVEGSTGRPDARKPSFDKSLIRLISVTGKNGTVSYFAEWTKT